LKESKSEPTVHSFLRPVAFLLTFGVALSAFPQTKALNRITRAIDDRETTLLQGNTHPLLQHAADQGRMDGGVQLESVSLVFKRTAAQEAAVEKLLADQLNPSSPSYHKWLTPEQYADRFGLSTGDVDAVVAWLQAQGFTVNRVARSRTEVWFSGSVSRIETVFRTEMHRYLINGEPHFANSTEPAVPAALSGVVLGFRHLDDFRPKARVKSRVISKAEVKAHFTRGGLNFLAPDDFTTIYDLKPLYNRGFDGNGQQLVVVGQSAINTSDIDAFRSAFNLPARTSSNFQLVLVPNSGTSTVVSGDVDESSLDLEWSAGIATGATEIFVYVGNNSNFNVFDSIQYAIDNNLAPVISISYGNCEAAFSSANATTFEQLAQQANMQGQTLNAASGDFGPADCDASDALPSQGGIAIDIPGALPEVTCVGGTEFNEGAGNFWNTTNNANGGSAISYIPETTWNDTLLVGLLRTTGGGVSTLFAKPSWQTGTGVPNDGKRDVPDIALAASPEHDGYLFCSSGSCTGGFGVAGGTSFGPPTFSGIVAIWDEATGSAGQGNVNPTLYSLHASHGTAFHDTTIGNNIVPCGAGTPNCPTTGALQYGFSATAGYDVVTGLGSLDGNVLITSAPGFVSTPDYVLSKNAALTIPAPGQSGTSTITVSSINGFTGTVDLSCAGLSTTAEMTCTVNPTSVVLSGTPMTASVSISTMAAHFVSGSGLTLSHLNTYRWFAASGTLLAGAFLFGIPVARRRWAAVLTLVVVALLAAAVGCSGGSSSPSNPGTPAGTYTATVTASVSGGQSHATTVTIIVK
jgi:subtilase family serine protease